MERGSPGRAHRHRDRAAGRPDPARGGPGAVLQPGEPFRHQFGLFPLSGLRGCEGLGLVSGGRNRHRRAGGVPEGARTDRQNRLHRGRYRGLRRLRHRGPAIHDGCPRSRRFQCRTRNVQEFRRFVVRRQGPCSRIQFHRDNPEGERGTAREGRRGSPFQLYGRRKAGHDRHGPQVYLFRPAAGL